MHILLWGSHTLISELRATIEPDQRSSRSFLSSIWKDQKFTNDDHWTNNVEIKSVRRDEVSTNQNVSLSWLEKLKFQILATLPKLPASGTELQPFWHEKKFQFPSFYWFVFLFLSQFFASPLFLLHWPWFSSPWLKLFAPFPGFYAHFLTSDINQSTTVPFIYSFVHFPPMFVINQHIWPSEEVKIKLGT